MSIRQVAPETILPFDERKTQTSPARIGIDNRDGLPPTSLPARREKLGQQPRKAYLFDVDGVLTNPDAKRVEQEGIFEELIKRLQRQEPVALNTGRSLDFMIAQILDPLESRITDRHLLHNLFAIGEKGATWVTHNTQGKREIQVDQTVSVPKEIQDGVRQLISKPPYVDLLFYDETKRSMVSVELKPGRTIGEFQDPEQDLALEIEKLLTKYNMQDQLRIDFPGISIDVENVHVGKGFGARRFVELLTERGIDPLEYVGFGDRTSDYTMYEALLALGKKAEFVFVGDPAQLAEKSHEGVIFTTQLVDKGTLEYLQQES